jgi:hypothetical protein
MERGISDFSIGKRLKNKGGLVVGILVAVGADEQVSFFIMG